MGRPLIVLLGATGFVGSALLDELATRPIRLRAVARTLPAPPSNGVADFEAAQIDLTNSKQLADVLEEADVVVHCVAHIAGASTWRIESSDHRAERVNVGIISDLVDALRLRTGRHTRVVYIGAASQVGLPPVEVVSESQPDSPCGAYDLQKLRAENTLLEAHHEGLLTGLSLRLPTIYGYRPGRATYNQGVVSKMVHRAIDGEPITMWHDGSVKRDLLHLTDMAWAVAKAIENIDRIAGRYWLIGTGEGQPLGQVFQTVADLVAEYTHRPGVAVTSVSPPAYAQATDMRGLIVDSSAFREQTGWAPRVALDDGLRATVAAIWDARCRFAS